MLPLQPLQPLGALLPHRPPWLLIDRVVSVDGGTVVAEKRVSVGDSLVGAEGFGGPLIIEALAQTAACLMGAMSDGASGHRGYLVAARAWKFPSFARPGETLTLTATRTSTLGSLHGFAARAHVGERLVASGDMSFAVVIDG